MLGVEVCRGLLSRVCCRSLSSWIRWSISLRCEFDFAALAAPGFVVDANARVQRNGVYEKYFGQTKPARSCVAVRELPKGVPVEMECIALSGTG